MVLCPSLDFVHARPRYLSLTCIANHPLAAQQPRVSHYHDHVGQDLLAAFRRHAARVSRSADAVQVLAEESHRVEPQLAEPREAGERLEVVQESS